MKDQEIGTRMVYMYICSPHLESIQNAQFDKPVASVVHICITYISPRTYAPFERLDLSLIDRKKRPPGQDLRHLCRSRAAAAQMGCLHMVQI